jgi:hypothetical protein
MNQRIEQAIEAYQDGTLDAAGAEVLVNALRGAEAASVREAMALAGLLGQAFTTDAAVERSVRERLAGERSGSAVLQAVRRSITGRNRRSRRARVMSWWPQVAAAAVLVVAIGGAVLFSGHLAQSTAECRIESSVALTVGSGTGLRTIMNGGALFAGERLTVPGKAVLVWADGSRVILGPETQVELTRPSSGPGCRLLVGAATAEIAPQRPGLPFAIATPESRIDVLGTRFRVVAGVRSTRVDLHEGAVRLTRVSDARTLTLRPAEFAVVADGEEFVARSTTRAPSPTTVALPATTEPAWQPLFANTGLDGWIQQHGQWLNTHGHVRGQDPHWGKARLLWRHAVADLELSCRLRIIGVEFAEVQVGEYNWFAEVPSKGEEWVQVEIRQRGNDLSITADGVALPLKAGDGKPMRAGALGFYVMPGGTVEIFDARFRIPPPSPTR